MNHILMKQIGAVGVITLARPERFNALDVAMAQDLRKAGLSYARDDSVRCVVLAGGNKVFCSGVDLRYVAAHGGNDGNDADLSGTSDLSYLQPEMDNPDWGYGAAFKQVLEYTHSTISEIRRAPKPFIAAVKGIAAAGGFGLAMACDLILASEDAAFEWAYNKTALTGAESATFFLPRLLGLHKAMELVLLNPRLTAAAALDAGLVAAIFPTATFDDDVMAIAEQLAAGPTHAYGITKSLVNDASGGNRLDMHLDRELDCLTRVADGPEFAEGLDAFFAKRPPQFVGD